MRGGGRPSVEEMFGVGDSRTMSEDEYDTFGLGDAPHSIGRASSGMTLERIKKTRERCPELVIVSHEKTAKAALGELPGEAWRWMRHFEKEVPPHAREFKTLKRMGAMVAAIFNEMRTTTPERGQAMLHHVCRCVEHALPGDAGDGDRRPLRGATTHGVGPARDGGSGRLSQGGSQAREREEVVRNELRHWGPHGIERRQGRGRPGLEGEGRRGGPAGSGKVRRRRRGREQRRLTAASMNSIEEGRHGRARRCGDEFSERATATRGDGWAAIFDMLLPAARERSSYRDTVCCCLEDSVAAWQGRRPGKAQQSRSGRSCARRTFAFRADQACVFGIAGVEWMKGGRCVGPLHLGRLRGDAEAWADFRLASRRLAREEPSSFGNDKRGRARALYEDLSLAFAGDSGGFAGAPVRARAADVW